MCLNGSICSSCITGYYLSSRSTCESVCQTRSVIVSGASSFSCQKCPYDCFECDINARCVSCSSNSYRVMDPSTFRCVPMVGYFDDRF
jgi:hypothetical protein